MAELLAWINTYVAAQRVEIAVEKDVTRREMRLEMVTDLCSALVIIAHDASSIPDVVGRITAAFTADSSKTMITLTTVHQVKGLETADVWLLADTFSFYRKHFGRQYTTEQNRPISEEEINMAYVATTRAKNKLNIVVGTRQIG